MERRSSSGWIILLLLFGILVGVGGGAVMGGVTGYYVARNQPAAITSSGSPQLTSARTTNPAPAVTNLSVNEDSAIIDTVKTAAPAVVTVMNTLQGQTGRQGAGANVAEGSGVIIDQQGHIITNSHVVEGARQIDVIFQDGSKTTAQLVGADAVSDLAVLQVNGNVPAYVPLGNSDSLQLGETVIAIGSPLGNYRGSVTVGVVSGLNRSVQGTGQEDLIQTDAAINHGNSGGPLINLAGQIIGINTLVVRDTTLGDVAEGLGFAIPSNTVSRVAQQLMAQGRVDYPFIGISYAEITPQSASAMNLDAQQGALVQQVTPNSAASKAGIQSGDVITALDNSKIDEAHSLRSILFQYKAGDTVTVTVLRDGNTLSLKLTLTSRPAQSNAGAPG